MSKKAEVLVCMLYGQRIWGIAKTLGWSFDKGFLFPKQKGGITENQCNKKHCRSTKSEFSKIVQVVASSESILDHVKNAHAITTNTDDGHQ